MEDHAAGPVVIQDEKASVYGYFERNQRLRDLGNSVCKVCYYSIMRI